MNRAARLRAALGRVSSGQAGGGCPSSLSVNEIFPKGLGSCSPYGGNTECREYYLGFESLAINGGVTANAQRDPQDPFVGKELIVPSDISAFFTINSMNVGRQPQAVAEGDAPATAWSEASLRAKQMFDPAWSGKEIILRVTNNDAIAHDFRAVAFGDSVAN